MLRCAELALHHAYGVQRLQVCASRSGASDKLDLDFVWHLQTPLNCMAEDAAVFMELQQWKADKKKVHVHCTERATCCVHK